MNIPKAIGWGPINERINQLNVVGINHTSFGFPPETSETDKNEIKEFFLGMGALFENTMEVQKDKDNEWFVYPEKGLPGYEHLLMPDGTVDKPFYHMEIDVKNTDDEIKGVFPEAWEEQPHMYWLTISKDFLNILWAVIITNKRYL